MKQEYLAQNIVNDIKNVIGFQDTKSNIGIHEPFFEDTNAWKYVKDCIDTAWVSSTGNWVKKFENQLSEFTGAKHVIAVTNGTVALRLALHVVGVRNNDEVILPPMTFVASANAISHLGAIPHFVDIDENNLGLSSLSLRKRLEDIAFKKDGKVINKETGRRIAAILPVHIFGNPADIESIKKISLEWNIPIVEDAAEALGSWIRKSNDEFSHCGLLGDIGTLSFNGNKLITTGGGGAIITNNTNLADTAEHLSKTAKVEHPWEFIHDQIGWNDRMPNINAALGFAQLENIEKLIRNKKDLFEKYKEVLSNYMDIELINNKSNSHISNNWLISLKLKIVDNEELKFQRMRILEIAHKDRILLRPVWKLLNSLEIYKKSPCGDLSNSINQEYRIINLPSSPQLNYKNN